MIHAVTSRRFGGLRELAPLHRGSYLKMAIGPDSRPPVVALLSRIVFATGN
jgi:hypothetical protein